MTDRPVREFVQRSWLVVATGMLATLGLLYALASVGRLAGSEALAAAGLAVTLLNVVAVVGAGHGIRVLQIFFAAGNQRGDRLRAVEARVVNARDAVVVLAAAWASVGALLVVVVPQSQFFVVAWVVSLPAFVLAPHVAINVNLMQLANQERRVLRYTLSAVVIEVVGIAVVGAVDLSPTQYLAGILALSQLATVGVLVPCRRWLRQNEVDLWQASRAPRGAWFGDGWFTELRLASFTAWDALAIMGYYAAAVALAGTHSAESAAVVALVASINRAVIVPLKAAGLVGGRLVRQNIDSEHQLAVARKQVAAVAGFMVLAGGAVMLAGQYSEQLTGVPRAVGAIALLIGGAQLLLEPWVGFASGQGKVMYSSGFGVWAISGSVVAVAAPLMILLSLLFPSSPVSYVLPFVVARAVALVLILLEQRRAEKAVAVA